jgi:hypothetical protein
MAAFLCLTITKPSSLPITKPSTQTTRKSIFLYCSDYSEKLYNIENRVVRLLGNVIGRLLGFVMLYYIINKSLSKYSRLYEKCDVYTHYIHKT